MSLTTAVCTILEATLHVSPTLALALATVAVTATGYFAPERSDES